MADILYGRQARLTIQVPVSASGNYKDVVSADQFVVNGDDDPTKPGLRIKFKIDKSTEKEPNTSEISVYNLSPITRGRLQVKGVKILLEAGYITTGMSRYFLGDVRTVDQVREGPDWITKMKVGDGERAYRFARANLSFSPGTSKATVIRAIAAAGGIGIGNVDDFLQNVTGAYSQGYVATGRWSDALHKVINGLGFEWSIQDGEVQLLTPNGSIVTTVPDITPDSGLIGSPEMGTPNAKKKPALVKFKCLLTPVRAGGQVGLKSARYDGIVKAKKLSYEGDTHGNEWYTTIDGVIVPNAKAVGG